jgi:myo-inositol-1(or 4)-monophosphatase
MLSTAIAAARAAGQVLRQALDQPRATRLKGPHDLVTDADLAAQQAIVEVIRNRFPEHGFLGEEQLSVASESPYSWIIDPLDGTTNYAHQFPFFCVSIALHKENEQQVAVVYDPVRDHLFTAERGGGAYLGKQRLRVSGTKTLSEALVGQDWARGKTARAATLERATRLMPLIMTLRSAGSAVLGLTYVAAGWLDAYYHLSLAPWDSAAASLLICEAGGVITDLKGHPWQPNAPHCLATNGQLYESIWPLVRIEDDSGDDFYPQGVQHKLNRVDDGGRI